mgnify:CR=1 FL=1
MHKIIAQPRQGELRIQKKIILNKNSPNNIEVAIGEIEAVDLGYKKEIHYIISFGGDKTIRIINKENWNKFLEMVQWLEWDPNKTQEIYIPVLDNFSEAETYENTVPRALAPASAGHWSKHRMPTPTLEYECPYLEDDNEIIDGIPIYDNDE